MESGPSLGMISGGVDRIEWDESVSESFSGEITIYIVERE